MLLPVSATYTLPALSTATPQDSRTARRCPCRPRCRLPATPASVVTTPAGVTFRIVLLQVSATYTLPALSTATPSGWQNRAALPVPSALPEASRQPGQRRHHPAGRHLADRVVAGVRHIDVARAVHRHAARTLNRAARPVPSALPELPANPARVVTTPAGVTFRIVWLSVSAT